MREDLTAARLEHPRPVFPLSFPRSRGPVSPLTWAGAFFHVLTLLAVACYLSACATVETLPPPKVIRPAEIRSLAGKWEGWADFPWGKFSIASTLERDGTFRLTIVALRFAEAPSHSDAAVVEGSLKVSNGRILYEMPFSEGSVALHETADRRILRFDGTATSAYHKGKPVSMEWVRAKKVASR